MTTDTATADKRPLHLRIRQDIEAQINDGTLRPGHKIPFEHELMQTYGCARMTVNQALSALSAEGLIERRKRAGSFVKLPRVDSTVLDVPDIQIEVAARGETYRFELTSKTVRTASAPDEIELAGKGGRILHLTGVHYAAERPMGHEDRLINLGAVPEAEHADFSAQSPGHWLLEAVPWTQVENQISAINANADTTRLLWGDRKMVCLMVERRTWRADERITTVRQIFDSKTYRLVARSTRDEVEKA
jgi:GntR family transcriptional regulator, histidine utilization repressor